MTLSLPTLRKYIRDDYGGNYLKELTKVLEDDLVVEEKVSLRQYAWSLIQRLNSKLGLKFNKFVDMIMSWHNSVENMITSSKFNRLAWKS